MARIVAYNSLGAIVGAGGIEQVASAIASGKSAKSIKTLAEEMFLEPRLNEVATLISLAREEVASARRIEEGQLSSPLDIEDIPLNPALFGDEPEGRRFLFSVEFTDPLTEEKIRVNVETATAETLGDILAAALEVAMDIVSRYETHFEDIDATRFRPAFTSVLLAARRY